MINLIFLILLCLNFKNVESKFELPKLDMKTCTYMEKLYPPNQYVETDVYNECECKVSSWKNDEYLLPGECIEPTSFILEGNFEHFESSHFLKQRKKIEYLKLKNEKLFSISEDLCTEFPELIQLFIESNNFGNKSQEDPGYLKRLFSPKNKLQVLSLIQTNLPPLPLDTFTNLKDLKLLKFGYDIEFCANWKNYEFGEDLEELVFAFCNISTFLTPNVLKLEKLKTLTFYGSNFTLEEMGRFEQLQHLETLVIGGPHFVDKLPNRWLNSTSLKTLYIKDMQNLIEIDNCAFCGVPNLQFLHFDRVPKLKTIHPNSFGAVDNFITSLIEFDVSQTDLEVLPENFVKMSDNFKIYAKLEKFSCDHRNKWIVKDSHFVGTSKRFKEKFEERCSKSPQWQNSDSSSLPHPQALMSPKDQQHLDKKSGFFDKVFKFFDFTELSCIEIVFRIVFICFLIACLIISVLLSWKCILYSRLLRQHKWTPIEQPEP
ncbi:Leucine Rich repeat-containing domain protein [Aphelenchoides bicaudatus]|nr:Leucine Rich repeat-containing domain protein [Aphelenchoides bicaudatus]